MPRLVNPQTGEEQFFADADAYVALNTGWDFPQDGGDVILATASGGSAAIPAAKAREYVLSRQAGDSMNPASPGRLSPEMAYDPKQELIERERGTLGQKALTFIEGAVDTASFGLVPAAMGAIDEDYRLRSEERAAVNPVTRTVGAIAGIAPAFAIGGGGAVGTIARATPIGQTAVRGAQVTSKLGGGVGAWALGGAAEGTLYGGAQVVNKALRGDELSLSGVIHDIGVEGVIGGGFGALGGGISKAVGAYQARAAAREAEALDGLAKVVEEKGAAIIAKREGEVIKAGDRVQDLLDQRALEHIKSNERLAKAQAAYDRATKKAREIDDRLAKLDLTDKGRAAVKAEAKSAAADLRALRKRVAADTVEASGLGDEFAAATASVAKGIDEFDETYRALRAKAPPTREELARAGKPTPSMAPVIEKAQGRYGRIRAGEEGVLDAADDAVAAVRGPQAVADDVMEVGALGRDAGAGSATGMIVTKKRAPKTFDQRYDEAYDRLKAAMKGLEGGGADILELARAMDAYVDIANRAAMSAEMPQSLGSKLDDLLKASSRGQPLEQRIADIGEGLKIAGVPPAETAAANHFLAHWLTGQGTKPSLKDLEKAFGGDIGAIRAVPDVKKGAAAIAQGAQRYAEGALVKGEMRAFEANKAAAEIRRADKLAEKAKAIREKAAPILKAAREQETLKAGKTLRKLSRAEQEVQAKAAAYTKQIADLEAEVKAIREGNHPMVDALKAGEKGPKGRAGHPTLRNIVRNFVAGGAASSVRRAVPGALGSALGSATWAAGSAGAVYAAGLLFGGAGAAAGAAWAGRRQLAWAVSHAIRGGYGLTKRPIAGLSILNGLTFGDRGEGVDLKTAYNNRIAELRNAGAGSAAETLGMVLDSELAGAVMSKADEVRTYLLDRAPETGGPWSRRSPTDADIIKWSRMAYAATQPYVAVGDILGGAGTEGMAQTLRDLYPEVVSATLNMFLTSGIELGDLDYNVRLNLGLLIGQPLDPMAKAGATFQQMYMQYNDQAMAGAQGQARGPMTAGPSARSEQALTDAQKL